MKDRIVGKGGPDGLSKNTVLQEVVKESHLDVIISIVTKGCEGFK